jgi:hypothetical protein
MTPTRTFWIAWCCFWALAWLLAGFFTLFLAWVFVPFSLLAILLPVGRGGAPLPRLTAYVRSCPECGAAAAQMAQSGAWVVIGGNPSCGGCQQIWAACSPR